MVKNDIGKLEKIKPEKSCHEHSDEKNRKDTGKTLYGRGFGVYNERKILGNALSQGLLIFSHKEETEMKTRKLLAAVLALAMALSLCTAASAEGAI